MGILEKNIILGSANASPNMIFFKDPIYFHITPLSVYITNNVMNLKSSIYVHMYMYMYIYVGGLHVH